MLDFLKMLGYPTTTQPPYKICEMLDKMLDKFFVNLQQINS